MDALQISGKWYISSRRAAKEHGYHADYIGQLVRTGKVKGQKVGRSWYILADSLSDYLEKEGNVPAPKIVSKKQSEPEIKAKKAVPKLVATLPAETEQEEEETEEEVHEAEDLIEEAPVEEPATPAPAPQHMESSQPKVAREHPLLTYLQDEEPELPAVPPQPIVPQTTVPAAEPQSEEGTRIPIHATVKRWGAAMQAPKAQPVPSSSPVVHKLGAVPPRISRPPLRWLPLLVMGAGAFCITVALSVAVSSSVTAL